MCGIVGVILGRAGDGAAVAVQRALAAMAHRGPDGRGTFEFAGGAAGMVRLALVDLSDRAQQPLWSAARDVAILFNGEAYDFKQQRSLLEAKGHRFQTTSDTEVVLALYLEHGLDFVHHLRGMYAVAIFDWREHGRDEQPTVTLARDPLGIKPLYIAERGDAVAFASELRALLATGLVDRAVDPHGLACYLDHGFLVQPQTMIRGVRMLAAGTIEVFEGCRPKRVRRFMALPPAVPRQEDLPTAATRLRAILDESVALHTFADAEVGAFLSGGVDSTGIVALMRRHLRKLKTFSLRYPEALELDETDLAEAAARDLGCEHHTVDVAGRDVASVIERFAADLDQPSADGLNTWLVARAAAAHVKGVLSGLGGDEWFAGYPVVRRMAWLRSGWQGRALAGVAGAVRWARPALPHRPPRRLASLAAWRSPLALWLQAHSVFPETERWALMGEAGHGTHREQRILGAIAADCRHPEDESPVGLATLLDARVYMQSQLLRDSDATSMAHSLELRVPLVDAEVAAFSRSCLDQHKLAGTSRGGGDYAMSGAKRVLVKALEDVLPQGISSRPKRGFALPFEKWLVGPLAETLAETLSESSVRRRGLLDPRAVKAVLDDAHRGVPGALYPRAWSLMILELWCRGVLDRPLVEAA